MPWFGHGFAILAEVYAGALRMQTFVAYAYYWGHSTAYNSST